MAILEGIKIKNFRSLRDVTLGRVLSTSAKQAELPRLIAVIGGNGSGKSTLLDALGFLGDCLRDGVEAACDKPHRRGFHAMRTSGTHSPIEFEIRYRQQDHQTPINYSLHIDANQAGEVFVAKEELIHKPQSRKGEFGAPLTFLKLRNGKGSAWLGGGERPENRKSVTMVNSSELGIATLGAFKEHAEISKFREFLGGWYLSYFMADLARVIPSTGAQPHLNREGDNLANYMQFIERNNKRGLARMLNRISKRIPGLTKITTGETQDKRLLLEFHAQGFAKPFYQQAMSDGTLKLLAYLLLLEDPNPAPLVGIEEPENGLHHQLLGVLAKELQYFAEQNAGPQVLLTTHSPHLVDALSPEQVWILEKNADGHSQLTSAAKLNGVQEMYDEGLPMGSLWYSNHFGMGNPS